MTVYTPQTKNVITTLDEMAIFYGLKRNEGESLADFKKRLELNTRYPANATKQGLINGISNALELFPTAIIKATLKPLYEGNIDLTSVSDYTIVDSNQAWNPNELAGKTLNINNLNWLIQSNGISNINLVKSAPIKKSIGKMIGYGIYATNPLLEIKAGIIRSYREYIDQDNFELEFELRYDDQNYRFITDVVNYFFANSNVWELELLDSDYEYIETKTLYDQKNVKTFREWKTPSNVLKLEYSPILDKSLYFTNNTFFRSEINNGDLLFGSNNENHYIMNINNGLDGEAKISAEDHGLNGLLYSNRLNSFTYEYTVTEDKYKVSSENSIFLYSNWQEDGFIYVTSFPEDWYKSYTTATNVELTRNLVEIRNKSFTDINHDNPEINIAGDKLIYKINLPSNYFVYPIIQQADGYRPAFDKIDTLTINQTTGLISCLFEYKFEGWIHLIDSFSNPPIYINKTFNANYVELDYNEYSLDTFNLLIQIFEDAGGLYTYTPFKSYQIHPETRKLRINFDSTLNGTYRIMLVMNSHTSFNSTKAVEGDYLVDYANGYIYSKGHSEDLVGITYKYLDYPFYIKHNPIIVNSLIDENFLSNKSSLQEQETYDTILEKNLREDPKKELYEYANELYNTSRNRWGE